MNPEHIYLSYISEWHIFILSPQKYDVIFSREVVSSSNFMLLIQVRFSHQIYYNKFLGSYVIVLNTISGKFLRRLQYISERSLLKYIWLNRDWIYDSVIRSLSTSERRVLDFCGRLMYKDGKKLENPSLDEFWKVYTEYKPPF